MFIPPLLSRDQSGGHQRAVVLDKALVKTTNSQKGTDVLGGSWSRPLTDYLKLTSLRANAIGSDDKTEKLQFVGKELTLRRLCIEAFGSQNGKDLAQMRQMLLRSFKVNNQVVQVNGGNERQRSKIMSIVPWNVAGALHRPKGITLNR